MLDKDNQPLSYWWSIPSDQLIETLKINLQEGLTKNQVQASRVHVGSNKLYTHKPTNIVTLVLEGVQEPMMLVLIAIAILSLMFGQLSKAVTMIFVVVAYILVECLNTYRTDRAMMKLKKLATPTATVLRDGKRLSVPTEDIVIGDILIITEGTLVPADARLLRAVGLIVNEASLTGESFPVHKKSDVVLDKDAPLADRINSIFAGTLVVSGESIAVVMAVGTTSEFGSIAQKIQQAQQEKTFLQIFMTKLAAVLAIFALILSALIPAIGFIRGLSLQDMVLTWLSLTFLMIPGQPPIIITMALALAAFELARKQIIVKRLRGVEILGQTTAIVSDKTGTMTEGTMKVATFILADGSRVISLPVGIRDIIALAIPAYSNDPTDTAVRDALHIHQIPNLAPVAYKGFSDTQPWRDLAYEKNGTVVHVVTGPPELLLDASTLPIHTQQQLNSQVSKEAIAGKRIVAYALYEHANTRELLSNIQCVALAVLHDPVRQGVQEAVRKLAIAGITTYMVTGDHAATAQHIAKTVGIAGSVVSGDHIERMSDQELAQSLATSHVFARIDPSQKVRIVSQLQARGEVVAVIGDGINDALALKKADVGIAMGRLGTDLAREVADCIVADDSYVHIPEAIALGRKALDNFMKGLTYYLSAKLVLLFIFIIPLILGVPFPLSPMQIIIIELLMDLASSTIFVTEEAEPDLMQQRAKRAENFINRSFLLTIIRNSLGLALGITCIFLYLYATHGIVMAQTAALVTWLMGHIFLALNLKQRQKPLLCQGIFANYFALCWLVVITIFSLVITTVPWLYTYFNTTWLTFNVWVAILLTSIAGTFWIEIKKIIRLKLAIPA